MTKYKLLLCTWHPVWFSWNTYTNPIIVLLVFFSFMFRSVEQSINLVRGKQAVVVIAQTVKQLHAHDFITILQLPFMCLTKPNH